MINPHYKIGRVNISITNMQDVIRQISICIHQNCNKYVCVANLRTVTFAHKNTDYRQIVNNAFLNIPDGMPLVWAGRLWGEKETYRVCGPDLLDTMLKDKTLNFKHFFLGETPEVLTLLQQKCETEFGSCIAGTYSPPFIKDYHNFDYNYIAKLINISRADVVWIALGAPKQDFFANQLFEKLNGKVVIGVGAAFRYILGEYKQPPAFFRKLAFTGFWWRVKYHPFQSLIWYIKHTVILLYFFIIIIANRILKLKIYE
jgi:N-acetylglucosaminyldiphosphoundecaprenol N-acetyl-beta-D-mannosaminyltransferase